mmetsp:Transcript_22586/g.27928  ORF Transcript_22586/g.27928 Transcript_22586/m.27928 type:complete len:218 (+) Transcript_22586:634-1287(+)
MFGDRRFGFFLIRSKGSTDVTHSRSSYRAVFQDGVLVRIRVRMLFSNAIKANGLFADRPSIDRCNSKQHLFALFKAAFGEVELRGLGCPYHTHDDAELEGCSDHLPVLPVLRYVHEVEHEDRHSQPFDHLPNSHYDRTVPLLQEFLQIERVGRDTAAEAQTHDEEAHVALHQRRHPEGPEVDWELDELAAQNDPLAAIQVRRARQRQHRDHDAYEID